MEGILTIDTRLESTPAVPTVCVANHAALPGVSCINLDEDAAAMQSLRHLYDLGHRKVVFMRGQSFSSDSEVRWHATVRAAKAIGIAVADALTLHLTRDTVTPELGYPDMRDLLQRTRAFTAVLCFNDISAIGVIRSLTDAGLRVPEDCSVVGFDDISVAEFQIPRLTTVRQPMHIMGRTAAETLLRCVAGEAVPSETLLQPELIVRGSSARAPQR